MGLQPAREQATSLLRPGHLIIVRLATNHTQVGGILSAAAFAS